MIGIEQQYVNLMIRAAVNAHSGLMTTPTGDLANPVNPGKADTLLMDWKTETRIRKTIKEYDDKIILVTEEAEPKRVEWPLYTDQQSRDVVMICDPIDRSKFFQKLVNKLKKDNEKKSIEELYESVDVVRVWEEEIAEKPSIITGATTAISCLVGGKVLASVIVNHIDRCIFLAVPAGIYMHTLIMPAEQLKSLSSGTIVKRGEQVHLLPSDEVCSSPKDKSRFVAYMGKSGYPENLNASMIYIGDCMEHIHHKEPGGPSRILYLSNLQKSYGPVGAVVSNGEKITEWIHWLSFAKYGKDVNGNQAVKIYEVANMQANVKDGVLMSCHPTYSIFTQREEWSFLDIPFLRRFVASSHYRAMLVVVASDNDEIIDAMNVHGYREVSDCL